jgi:hypothetical protein
MCYLLHTYVAKFTVCFTKTKFESKTPFQAHPNYKRDPTAWKCVIWSLFYSNVTCLWLILSKKLTLFGV